MKGAGAGRLNVWAGKIDLAACDIKLSRSPVQLRREAYFPDGGGDSFCHALLVTATLRNKRELLLAVTSRCRVCAVTIGVRARYRGAGAGALSPFEKVRLTLSDKSTIFPVTSAILLSCVANVFSNIGKYRLTDTRNVSTRIIWRVPSGDSYGARHTHHMLLRNLCLFSLIVTIIPLLTHWAANFV